jgi:RIO kinase 1
LRPDSELTGVFAYDESVADLDGVRQAISEAAADVD